MKVKMRIDCTVSFIGSLSVPHGPAILGDAVKNENGLKGAIGKGHEVKIFLLLKCL
jgi:hypothetical protein